MTGRVGATVGVNVGIVGATVGVMTGVKVGTIGAMVGMVGVKVGVRLHHIAPGKVVPVKGSVGATVGARSAVGQNARPPTVVGTVGVKARVGATRGVSPGATVVVVGNVVNGGQITAKTFDDKRLKIVIINKLMKISLSDLI